jgi:large subunit ribosomal protein L21
VLRNSGFSVGAITNRSRWAAFLAGFGSSHLDNGEKIGILMCFHPESPAGGSGDQRHSNCTMTMYAIIRQDGRQYKVEEGQELDIDYREGTAADKFTLGEVLCIGGGESVQIGKPVLAGASVTVEVVGVEQGPKIVVQKFRRRKNYRRRTGHRQLYTRVRVSKIQA